jgi:ABC-type amino acid transport substrate-binding protein
MLCPNCGTANDDASKFCNNCAQPLGVQTPSQSQPRSNSSNSTVPAPQRKSRNKTITIAVILIIGVLIVAALGATSLGGNKNNSSSAPNAPMGVTVLAGNSQTTINWTAPFNDGGSAITGYNVYRSNSENGTYALIASPAGTTYTDIGLVNGQTYWYKVCVKNGVGESASAAAAKSVPCKEPEVPTGLTILAGNAQTFLNWTAPKSNGGSVITNYLLYRSATSGDEVLLASLGNVRNYTDTALTNGRAYYYTISALNSVGEGAKSNEVFATSGWTPAATIVSRTVDATHYVFTIEGVSSSVNASYFSVTVTPKAGLTIVPQFGKSSSHDLEAGDQIFVNGTTGSTKYNLTLVYNPTGFAAGKIAWTTMPGTPPAPTGLTAVAGTVRVSLNWTAPSSNGGSNITGYNVYRAIGAGPSTYLTTVTSTTYLDSSLTSGQAYSYKVSAVNSFGEGLKTASVNSTPSLQNDLQSEVRSSRQLIVGTQVPYAPFEFYNTTTQKYEGIDMEIAQRVADELNVTLVIKTMDFDPLFAAVQTGKVDMAISAITITPARERSVNFTAPYYLANQAVLVKTSSSISNINNLNGTKVVTQLGTQGSDWVNTNLVDTGRISASKHVDLTDVAAAAAGVKQGTYSAFVVDMPVAYRYANDPTNGLKVAFVIPTDERYGICIPQNQVNFRNAVNNVISGMMADGSMRDLLLKYEAIGKSTPMPIQNGSYLNYSGTGTGGTQGLTGGMVISFGNLTSTGYVMTESITINGQTTKDSQTMNDSAGTWIDASSGENGSAGLPTFVGMENLQTNFGPRATDHYVEHFTGYTYDYWEDSSNQMLYQMKYTYTNGAIFTFKLTSTNMM